MSYRDSLGRRPSRNSLSKGNSSKGSTKKKSKLTANVIPVEKSKQHGLSKGSGRRMPGKQALMTSRQAQEMDQRLEELLANPEQLMALVEKGRKTKNRVDQELLGYLTNVGIGVGS